MNKTNQQIALKVERNSIIVNTLLSIFKIFTGIIGNSVAMISDGIESLVDLFSSFIVIVGIKISNRKADNTHQYGYERFECVAAIILSGLIFIVGIIIGWTGIQRVFSGKAIIIPGFIALVGAIVSVVVKESLYWYIRRAAKKIDSGALMADAWHSRSDGLSSVGGFVGILGARMGYPFMDSLAAIVICFFIVRTSIIIFIDAINKMTDKSCDEETAEAMREVILSNKEVLGIEVFRTRLFGNKIYVDVEIHVAETLSLKEGHDIAHAVHDAIEKEFLKVKHCMVHVTPIKE